MPTKPPRVGDQAQLLVGLVARQVDEGAAAGMVDRDRRGRGAGGVEAGALAAVREIDHQAGGVEPLDHFAAEPGQAAVCGAIEPSPSVLAGL